MDNTGGRRFLRLTATQTPRPFTTLPAPRRQLQLRTAVASTAPARPVCSCALDFQEHPAPALGTGDTTSIQICSKTAVGDDNCSSMKMGYQFLAMDLMQTPSPISTLAHLMLLSSAAAPPGSYGAQTCLSRIRSLP